MDEVPQCEALVVDTAEAEVLSGERFWLIWVTADVARFRTQEEVEDELDTVRLFPYQS